MKFIVFISLLVVGFAYAKPSDLGATANNLGTVAKG